MAVYEERLRQELDQDLEIGEIMIGERPRPLYESQVLAAERFFQPKYDALLETERLRPGLNRSLAALEAGFVPPIEKIIDVEGGMFLIPMESVPYKVYLWDRTAGFEELSETGRHQPGEPVVFSKSLLRATEGPDPAIEMEIVDYPDAAPLAALGGAALGQRDRYVRLRRLSIDPSRHMVGFIEDDPVVKVS